MALFGKKKKDDDAFSAMPPGMPPNMQGMGDDFPPPDMNQFGQGQPDPYGQPGFYNQQQPPDQFQSGMNPYPEQNQEQPGNQGFSQPSYSQPSFSSDDTKERVEEIAEAIIDEKWNELIKDINKIIEWKEHMDTEINRIASEIVNLKERFESLHRGVLGKISDYDKNLMNVGTEIKAMEKVFQNILPTFTENVNKLERFTKGTR
jgi:transcription termination factor NusB